MLVLTHFSLETLKRVIGKQCRPRFRPCSLASDHCLHYIQDFLRATRKLVDRRVDSKSIRFLTAVVRASLGSHVGKPSSAYGWSGGFSLEFSSFRPPLMSDQLNISEIFLKGL